LGPRGEIQRFYITNREYFLRLKEKKFERWFLKYYKHLKGSGGKLILDVGCGVGQVVNRLACDGLEAVGVDLSPIGIRIAKKERSRNASFIVASCYNLPFKDGCFRTVGCFDLLEHLENPESCIEEMVRVTMDDGTLIVASPNLLCPTYARGFKDLLLRTGKLIKRVLGGGCEEAQVEHLEPALDDPNIIFGRDLDAVTLIDPVTVRSILKRKGVNITYQSSYLGTKRLIEGLSTLPLLRSIGGGIFLVGTKRGNPGEEGKNEG